jgi:hypothetical protein
MTAFSLKEKRILKNMRIMNFKNGLKGYSLPNIEQELLLKAALLKEEEALTAYNQWIRTVDIDHLDRASYRLLPLLYCNMKAHRFEIVESQMMMLRRVYQLTKQKNRLLFQIVARLLTDFNRAGVKTIALKGAALVHLFYEDPGLRPMNDFDVLVPSRHVRRVITTLEKSGWTPMAFSPSDEYISVSHSHGFRDDKGREFDLHWHVLSQCREPNADVDFWRRSIPVVIEGSPTLVLAPEDQLLHVCVHGITPNKKSAIRWVADAATIVDTSSSELDWERLLMQCRMRSLTLPLKVALNYLFRRINVPIPLEVLRSLNNHSVPVAERIEFHVSSSILNRWSSILDLWFQHSRLMKSASLTSKILHFPKFLKKIWGVPAWKIPLQGFIKVISWK